MQPSRLRTAMICAVVLATTTAGCQLLPSDEESGKPITVGTTDVVTTLDPAGAYDAGSWAMYSNVYQSLLTFKPGGTTPVPDAARACSFSGSDLRTYSCTLRDDLTFANGRKITPADVRHSFERLLRIKADVGPQSLFNTLAGVTAEGQKVIFRLKSRDATFPLKLATGAGAIVDRTDYPASRLRKGNAVGGSGPYVLKEYTPGERARLEPNPKYRGALKESGGPIELRYFSSSEKLAAAWKEREVDVTHRLLPASVIAALNPSDPNLRMSDSKSAEISMFVFNMLSGSPMKEKAVRRAVASIVDRGRIADETYRSTVQPLYSLIPQGTLAHSNPFFDVYPEPSVRRARQILQDAGVETPVRFKLGHVADTGPTQEAKEIKRQLETGGLFKVDLAGAEWTVFQKKFSSGAYDAFTVGWFPDFPDPDNFTQPLVGKGSSLANGYRSDTVDRLIAETQRYDHRARTATAFKKVQREIAEDVPLLPMWQKNDYVLSIRDVGGSQNLTDGTGIWRLWELHWL